MAVRPVPMWEFNFIITKSELMKLDDTKMDYLATMIARQIKEERDRAIDPDRKTPMLQWVCERCGTVIENNEPTYDCCPNCGTKMGCAE